MGRLPQSWAALYRGNHRNKAGVAIFLTLDTAEKAPHPADLGVYTKTASRTINEDAEINLEVEWTDILPFGGKSVKLTPRIVTEGGPVILDAFVGSEQGGIQLTFRPLKPIPEELEEEWRTDSETLNYSGLKLSASESSYYVACLNNLCADTIKGRVAFFGCGNGLCWGMSETRYNINECEGQSEECFKKGDPAVSLGGEVRDDRKGLYIPVFLGDGNLGVREAVRYQ